MASAADPPARSGCRPNRQEPSFSLTSPQANRGLLLRHFVRLAYRHGGLLPTRSLLGFGFQVVGGQRSECSRASSSHPPQWARLQGVRVSSAANSYFVRRKNCCWVLEKSWSYG